MIVSDTHIICLWNPVGDVRPQTQLYAFAFGKCLISSRSINEMTQTYMLVLWCTDTTGSLSPRTPPQLISRSQAGSPGAFY